MGYDASLSRSSSFLLVRVPLRSVHVQAELPSDYGVRMKVVLIVAYVSMHGAPFINLHDMPDKATCNREAKQIFKNVKASTVRAWCHNVINVKGKS